MNDKPDSDQPDYVVKGFKPRVWRKCDRKWFKGSCAICNSKNVDVKFTEDGSNDTGSSILISLCRECYR